MYFYEEEEADIETLKQSIAVSVAIKLADFNYPAEDLANYSAQVAECLVRALDLMSDSVADA